MWFSMEFSPVCEAECDIYDSALWKYEYINSFSHLSPVGEWE